MSPSTTVFRPPLLGSGVPTTRLSFALVAALSFTGEGTRLNRKLLVDSFKLLWSMVILVCGYCAKVKLAVTRVRVRSVRFIRQKSPIFYKILFFTRSCEDS